MAPSSRTRTAAVLLLALLLPAPLPAQAVSGPLVVFNAGSLAQPFRALLRAFAEAHPGTVPAQENAGSLETARKLTELGKIPDVVAVADYKVIDELLVPRFATWQAAFARNEMVLLYGDHSIGATEVGPDTWIDVLRRPGVRTGRSDPALDPNGYRTLMVLQLAERHYRRPGLAKALLSAMPARWVRPKEADLLALLQAGELDYAWSYRSIAVANRLRSVDLPAEVDLGDPARAAAYTAAAVRLPATTRAGRDSVTFRGEPIVYALTIPVAAPHPRAAEAFVRYVFSPAGQAILRDHGFTLLDRPVVSGTPPAALRFPAAPPVRRAP